MGTNLPLPSSALYQLACGRPGCDSERTARRGYGLTHCPNHDDRGPSLSVKQRGGRPLLNCFAGCSYAAIVARLERGDGYHQTAATCHAAAHRRSGHQNGHNDASHVVATYDYRAADGTLLYQQQRYAPKDFRPRRPDGHDGWTYNLDGVERVPFRLPELLAAPASEPIVWCGGEKAALAGAAAGLVTSCNFGGDGGWLPAYADHLRGRVVIFAHDNDDSGRHHAASAAADCYGIAALVVIVALPVDAKGDLFDYLDGGATALDFWKLGAATAPWHPPDAAPDPFDHGEQCARLERDLAHAEERLQREQQRADEACTRAHEHGRMLDAVAAYIADVDIGPEVRLLVGLELAHYKRDPVLDHLGGIRWRLPQKLAARLAGVRSRATGKSYTEKLGASGRLPLGEPEPVTFTKKDGTRVDEQITTYLYAPLGAKVDTPPEAVAQQNAPILLARAQRLKAKRERRGDARRFSGCDEHPHARTKLRRHCLVCGKCLEPRGTNVFATAPVQTPCQGLRSRDREPSAQSLTPPPLTMAEIEAAQREYTTPVAMPVGAKSDTPPCVCPHGVTKTAGVYCLPCGEVKPTCAQCGNAVPPGQPLCVICHTNAAAAGG